ncbi:DUF4190 domain-containing protein [Allobranchiibius sp. CTAmp26]|uniref:DUF4190 domain-containing protein n=1 Tax=Allobranchiibius sp. CTAmp26 TaxID=2815214 RepID=UPI001AA18607|nr:DUF4190 domain-containing protein [Allobranchiibius sp. CTAmp26]MBO1753617.1 hypothetical protein [Allobranchiibius sp. CTAmp26]
MSNQPPYDGSQDPIHEQPTQGVPHVEGQGDDSGGAQSGGSGDWSAPPIASPYGGDSGSWGQSAPQYGGAPQYGQSAPYGQAPQYGNAPVYGQSAPYGQAEKDPYPQGGYDAYGQQGGYGGYQQQGYYSPPSPQGNGNNTSAIVLTVASGLAIFFCCGAGLPSLIMGIIALTKQAADPAGAARLAKIGWIVFGVLVALAVIAFVGLIALGTFAGGSGSSDTYQYGSTPSYSSTF